MPKITNLKYLVPYLSLVATTATSAQVTTLDINAGLMALSSDRFILNDPDSDTLAGIFSPNIELAYRGKMLESALFLSSNTLRHITADLFDRTTFDVSWVTEWKRRRSDFGLTFVYDEGLVEEFIELNDSLDVVSTDLRVQSLSAIPSFDWRLSEKNRLSLAYEFSFSRLEDPEDIEFEIQGGVGDQDEQRLDLGFFRQVSPITVLGIQGSFLAFRPDTDVADASEDSDLFGGSLFASFQFSEKFNLQATLGALRIESSAPADSERFVAVPVGSTIETAIIEAEYITQRSQLAFIGEIGTNQQLDGALDLQQTASISWNRDLNRSLQLRTRASYFFGERIDRQNISLSAGLAWQINKNFDAGLTYRYFEQQQDVDLIIDINTIDAVADVVENRLTFSLNYRLSQIRL